VFDDDAEQHQNNHRILKEPRSEEQDFWDNIEDCSRHKSMRSMTTKVGTTEQPPKLSHRNDVVRITGDWV
jgi:hypothetical protein